MVDDAASEHLGRVRALFADGSTAVGDALVGCDGAKSRVRETLYGAEAAALTHVPYGMFSFPCRLGAGLAERVRAMNGLFITSVHPGHGSMFWVSSTLLLRPLHDCGLFQNRSLVGVDGICLRYA